jgi:hypothetical protein
MALADEVVASLDPTALADEIKNDILHVVENI